MSAHPSISGIRLVLGGNVFGWTADQEASFAVLDTFYAGGGRMIDTAQGYSDWIPGNVGGESETMIGKWLAARPGVRPEMRIHTKTNMYGKPGLLAPAVVAEELEKSFERLQTDYIDLYYAHRDDEETPQQEVAAGFDELIKSGKIREIGASNFTAERLGSAMDFAAREGLSGYTVLQNEYNLIGRSQYEGALQRICVEHGVVMLPFFGLASGYLTGKYRSEADYAKSARGYRAKDYSEKGPAMLVVMDAIAAETGASLAAISLAWINAQPGIGAPIASARTPEQLDTLLKAMTLELTPNQLERLSAVGAQ